MKPSVIKYKMKRCPKCGGKIIQNKYMGHGIQYDSCITCGCSYTLGDSPESLNKQVGGDYWINPRALVAINGGDSI